jgi:hypothetical protein
MDPFLASHAEVLLPLAHIHEISGHYQSITGVINAWDAVSPQATGLSKPGVEIYLSLLGEMDHEVEPFVHWLKGLQESREDLGVGSYEPQDEDYTRGASEALGLTRISAGESDPILRRSYGLKVPKVVLPSGDIQSVEGLIGSYPQEVA